MSQIRDKGFHSFALARSTAAKKQERQMIRRAQKEAVVWLRKLGRETYFREVKALPHVIKILDESTKPRTKHEAPRTGGSRK